MSRVCIRSCAPYPVQVPHPIGFFFFLLLFFLSFFIFFLHQLPFPNLFRGSDPSGLRIRERSTVLSFQRYSFFGRRRCFPFSPLDCFLGSLPKTLTWVSRKSLFSSRQGGIPGSSGFPLRFGLDTLRKTCGTSHYDSTIVTSLKP